jgi:hypothetical protein
LKKCRRNGKQKLRKFCGRNVEEMGNKGFKGSGRNVQEMETQKKSFQDSGRHVEE